ncbi:pyridoxal phosphate-dependent aminotransferase [soil metagenome]
MPTHLSTALAPFGTTIFATMTRLAQQHGAINLAQGFPDFDGPAFIKHAAKEAIDREENGANQYAPLPGIPALRHAIADRFTADTGLACDPDSQVVVTAGCTEAIAAALLGLLNPGDEVILFEPFYDSYRAVVAMAGAVPRTVALAAPSAALHGPAVESIGTRGGAIIKAPFTFDLAVLRAAITPRTRVLMLNTPHNPTGKVFTHAELSDIAALCIRHNLIVISDEVYERLTFDQRAHIPIASLPGMAERTLTLSSLGKTFSLTGWKVGWAVGPAPLIDALRAAHQFLTFSVATPLQHAAAIALKREPEAVPELVALLSANRQRLAPVLAEAGLRVFLPEGTYFIMADHTLVSQRLGISGDRAFCQRLVEGCRIAAIPPGVFYQNPASGAPLVRFAICKKRATIDEAIARLATLNSL